jgi:hypothetical protein
VVDVNTYPPLAQSLEVRAANVAIGAALLEDGGNIVKSFLLLLAVSQPHDSLRPKRVSRVAAPANYAGAVVVGLVEKVERLDTTAARTMDACE